MDPEVPWGVRSPSIPTDVPSSVGDHADAPGPASSGGAGAAPPWLEAIPIIAAATVAGVGSVGLVLAMAGRFEAWLALLLGLPLTSLAVVPVLRRTDTSRSTRCEHGAALVAVVLALAFAAFAGRAPSEHLLVNRDPGSYASTATWLDRDGSLTVDARWAGFEPAGDAIEYAGSAQYDEGGGRLEFQFGHLTSVVLAVAKAIGGPGLMYRVPALAVGIGLVGVYAVAVRLTGRPVLSLAGAVGLGSAMPVLYVARDTFSEPISFLLLWAAIGVLLEVHRRPSVLLGLSGGLLLGATVATRIDSILFLALLWPAVAISLATSSAANARTRWWAWTACLLGAHGLAAVGLVDLFRFAGAYASDHDSLVRPLLEGLAGMAVVSAVGLALWRRWPGVSGVVTRLRGVAAPTLAGLLGLALLAGWFLRPHLGNVHGVESNALVQAIQRRDRLPADPTRTYAEHAVAWTSWYLGPAAMWAAVVGLVIAVHRTVTGRARPAVVVVAGLFLAAGTLSWWRPSIVPDHVWAMRRYVPAVLPSVALLAVFGVAEITDGISGRSGPRKVPRGRLLRPALALVGAALLVVPPAVTTWPVREERELRGFTDLVRWTCDQVGEDQAVIVVGAVRQSLPQTLRNWCGVPVGIAGPSFGPDQLATVIPAAALEGRSVVLVAIDRRELTPYDALITATQQSGVVMNDRVPLRRVDGPPTTYAGPVRLSVVVARVA